MENYNDEIFGFGNFTEENNDQISNFNYDSISGLGQSDYENEDLFSTEVENNNNSLFNNYYNQEPINVTNEINNVGVNYVENNELVNQFSNEIYSENPFIQNFGISNNVQGDGVQFTQENFDNNVPNYEMEDDFFEDFVNESPIVDNAEESRPKMNFDPMTGEPIKPAESVGNYIEQPVQAFKPESMSVAQVSETPMQPETLSVPEYSEVNEETIVEPLVMEQPMFEQPQVEILPEIPVVEEVPPIGPGLPGYVVPETQTFEMPIQPEVSSDLEYSEANEETIVEPLVIEQPMFEQPQVEILPETPVVEEQPVAPIESELSGYEVSVQPEVSSVPEYSEENEEKIVEPLVMEQPMFEQPQVEILPETPVIEEQPVAPIESEMPQEKIEISDTSIEELNKLTEYDENRIEETDINALFDKVSVNFKDASDIFRRNSDLKRKIDTRFEELKKLQSELENARKKQLDEINAYKSEVLDKLTEKKEEIERRLNVLKESQVAFEREKKEFEGYKKKEQENIDRVQKEVQSAYDDRREELNHIEDVLRKQKDSLDEERNQLSLDRIQYESDKNELANNLLKFNELVNSFTNGVNDIQG